MWNVLNVTWNVLNVCVGRKISKSKIVVEERVVGGACPGKRAFRKIVKKMWRKISKSKIICGERVVGGACRVKFFFRKCLSKKK
jgi:hypothetical protein